MRAITRGNSPKDSFIATREEDEIEIVAKQQSIVTQIYKAAN